MSLGRVLLRIFGISLLTEASEISGDKQVDFFAGTLIVQVVFELLRSRQDTCDGERSWTSENKSWLDCFHIGLGQ
jgi:hypothetical protein